MYSSGSHTFILLLHTITPAKCSCSPSCLVFFRLTCDTWQFAVWWLLPFVEHFCSFIVATGGSAVTVLPPVLFRLFSVLQNWLVFHSRLRGKSVLCRSADKSFLLVTHCLTQTHSHVTPAPLPAPQTHTHKLPESTNLAASRLLGHLRIITQQNRPRIHATGMQM